MSEKTAMSARVESDHAYHQFENLIRQRTAAARGPLFATDASYLFDEYLHGIPGGKAYSICTCGADRTGPSAEAHQKHCPATVVIYSGPRQHYCCSACRHFIERYGGLTTIDGHGKSWPVLWDNAVGGFPPFFQDSGVAMCGIVARARVTGVFLSSDEVWGIPQTGTWTHLSGINTRPFKHPTLTAEQMMAQKREEFGMLSSALADYSLGTVEQAVAVLKSDSLERSEKVHGVAEWFLSLHQRLKDVKHELRRANMIWLAVATAPVGFCHVRSTMISTLLDDIKSGMTFDAIKRRWAQKMHPLAYQRPQTITEGQIAAGNAVVEKLKSAGALQRRFAKMSDILPQGIIWKPRTQREDTIRGAFDHLIQRSKETGASFLELPQQTMTWVKFRDTVLPEALSLEYYVSGRQTSYYGLVTAVNAEAPPILQWDWLDVLIPTSERIVVAPWDMSAAALESGASEELKFEYQRQRNPVSWYLHTYGSPPQQWSLHSPSWVKVNLICRCPPHWQKPEQFAHHPEMALFALEGARATMDIGGAFFPESLRSEYRDIRHAMEAYANSAIVTDKEEGDANGYAIQSHDKSLDCLLRVRTAAGVWTVRLDRFD